MSFNLRILAGSLVLAAIALASFTHGQLWQESGRQHATRIVSAGVEPILAIQSAHGRAKMLEARYLAKAAGSGLAPEPSELVAELTEMLSRLGDAGAALPEGPTSATLAELRYSISRLRATQGETSERLLRRELADISDRFDRTAMLMRADVGLMRDGARDAFLHVSQVQAGWLALMILGIVVLALFLSAAVGSGFRATAAALRQLGDDAARPIAPGPRGLPAEILASLAALQSSLANRGREAERAASAERGRLEEEIERQRERFAGTIETMSQGYCLLDETKGIVAANASFKRMFAHLRPGAPAPELRADPALEPLFRPQSPRLLVCETPEGEVIQLRREAVSGRCSIIVVENITEQRATSQRIEQLAGCDALTGLPNRARFYDRLGEALRQGNRKNEMAVLCLDIEGFRNVNATFGNAVGDTVLRVAAERLASVVGERDVVARTGADEFAIIRRASGQPDDCAALAAAIADAFKPPVRVEGGEVTLLASIGMVQLKPRGQRVPLDPYAVMQDGEMALARARAERPGSHRLFAETMRQEMDARRQLESDLRTALEGDEFELHYQPFVDVASGRVSGFEALIRWHHPVRGLVSPAEFVPLAEETGLIDGIGLWVLREACRTACRWPERLTVSVNLSPVQFRNPALVENVATTLRASGLDPRRLQLEVTESVFLDEGEGTLESLAGLRALGLKISMDDFGTGYSSLGYLSRFPFDKIKIDQSFVRRMERPENIAIVRAIIGLSSAMGMSVIAEGVETRQHFDALCREGCREMQGYLFGRPRPAAELPSMILRIDGAFSRDGTQAGATLQRSILSVA